VIGNFLKVSSMTAKRSGACASILGAALILSVGGVNSALAQVPTSPDTVQPAQTDTTNNLVMSSDTSKEVKHVVKKGDTLWDLAEF
jgi:nucleoid-associated protein YgaU